MDCPNCGRENAADNRFCENCGSKLTQVTEYPELTYAGFWLRFIAWIIDYVLVGLVSSIIIIPSFFFYIHGSQPDVIIWFIMYLGAYFILPWLYFAIMESSSKQATLGKMVVGVIVTDESGNRISFARATGRFFGKFLSRIMLYIGHLMIAFTKKKQGLHDIIAATLVVKK